MQANFFGFDENAPRHVRILYISEGYVYQEETYE